MTEPSVTCGCGRRMSLDALHGKGAYRCGCGVQVKLSLPSPPVICGWRPSGAEACRSVVVRTADPVPLCREHHKTFRALWFPEENSLIRYNRLGLICDCTPMPHVDVKKRADDLDEAAWKSRYPDSVVYYASRGDLIKIGITANLQQRMYDLDVDEVLATERGNRDLEVARHHQFRHLLARKREWFRPAPDLLAHIAEVKAAMVS